MNAAQVMAYIQAKHPNCLQSPVALACRAESDMPLLEAIEHAKRCLASRDDWDVETLGHNIESNFPELDADQCDDVARAVLEAV